MVFKLVRIDTQEPCKIQLTIGKHVIGRGKFLHNDETDKRVSRNHAELEVTSDTVSLKSLHQNPCFFMKKSIETHLLLQDTTVCLCHGDKFGLLPDHFWYEVLHCPDQDNAEERATISETTENGIHNDEDERMNQTGGVREQDNVTPGSSAVVGKEEKTIKEAEPIRSASPSLLTAEEEVAKQVTAEPQIAERVTTNQEPVDQDSEHNYTAVEEQVNTEQDPIVQDTENYEPVTTKQEPADQDTESYVPSVQVPRADEARSPAKRDHSSTESSPVDVKKVKLERVDVAGDAAAGPSNGQEASSDTNGKASTAAPASPAKPAPPPRERCIYGVNCYRRNPQHKAQFSHPSDSDWGGGERGVCPYGGACRRAHPRHWDTHSHPPGTRPPPDRGPRPGQRRNRRQRNESESDDDDVEDSPVRNLIVTGKRARKTVNRQDWSGAESDEEIDPYGTDESDEWQPPSDVTTSQDFSQDV